MRKLLSENSIVHIIGSKLYNCVKGSTKMEIKKIELNIFFGKKCVHSFKESILERGK